MLYPQNGDRIVAISRHFNPCMPETATGIIIIIRRWFGCMASCTRAHPAAGGSTRAHSEPAWHRPVLGNEHGDRTPRRPVMVWYGMVNVDLYSAIITKVSNALNTLVSGERPGLWFSLGTHAWHHRDAVYCYRRLHTIHREFTNFYEFCKC